MNIKTKNNKQAKILIDDILLNLYHLEDLNEYRKNSITKVIDIMQQIKIKDVTQ